MSHISPVLWQFLVKWMTNFSLFPPEASKIAPQMDALYFFMVLVSLIGLTIVILLVTSFSILYSKKRHPVAVQIEGSTLLEATWTIIPLGLFPHHVCLGRAHLLPRLHPARQRHEHLRRGQAVDVEGGASGRPARDQFAARSHGPRRSSSRFISQDVFHSFSIPAFRVKREAIPGRYTTVWFEATTPGTYHLFCTQYCGTDHSHMIGDVVVLTPDDYKKWLAGSTSGASLAQNGERLFASLSCTACHNARPDARGPSLANVYGSQADARERPADSADEAYLREAILNPSQHITQGYAPIMPTYQGQISEDGVIALVEYIKNLNSDYRVQQTTATTTLLPESEGKAGKAPAGKGSGSQGSGAGMVKQ